MGRATGGSAVVGRRLAACVVALAVLLPVVGVARAQAVGPSSVLGSLSASDATPNRGRWFTLDIALLGLAGAEHEGVVDIELPAALRFLGGVPSGGTCALLAGTRTVRCEVPIIAAYPLATHVQLRLSATRTGSVTLAAVGSTARGSFPIAALELQVVDALDLAITSVSDGRDVVEPGVPTTYRIEIENQSPFAVQGHVDVAIPPGATVLSARSSQLLVASGCAIGSERVVCRPPPLQSTQRASIDLVVVPPASGPFALTATIDARGPDIDPSDDSATDVDGVAVLAHDLVVALADADAANVPAVGERRTVRATVTNEGPGIVRLATVDLHLPAGAAFTAALDGACSVVADDLQRCLVTDLPVGAAVRFDVELVLQAEGDLVVHAAVSTLQGEESDPSDDAADLVLAVQPPAADLELVAVVQDTTRPHVLGEPVVVVALVWNRGPSTVAADVRYTLPASLVAEDVTAFQGAADCVLEDAGHTVRCRTGPIADSLVHDPLPPISLGVSARAVALGDALVHVDVAPAPDGSGVAVPDPDPSDDSAALAVDVLPNTADLDAVRGGESVEGSVVRLFPSVRNLGPGPARQVTAVVRVSRQLAVRSASVLFERGTCVFAARTATCTIDELPAPPFVAAFLDVDVEVVAPDGSAPTVRVTVSHAGVDPNPSNDAVAWALDLGV